MEDLFLIASPATIGALGEPVRFDSLPGLPLVLPGPAQGLRALLDRRAAEAGFALSVPFEADSTYTIKGLVAAGAGYSILSAHAVRNEVAAGTLAIAPIGAPGISRSVQLATGQGRRTDPSVAAVAGIIREVVAANL